MKELFIISLTLAGALFPILEVHAVCPVCTVAVAAGVGLSRWLGIDDSITGLWVGAFVMSVTIWTINWMNNRNIHFRGRKISITVGYYLLVVGPLYQWDIIGHLYNKLWGMDKLLLGIIIGSVFFGGGALLHTHLKEHHGNRSYFPLQSTVIPVVILLMLSGLFYFITR